jgi:hypothetical protein
MNHEGTEQGQRDLEPLHSKDAGRSNTITPAVKRDDIRVVGYLRAFVLRELVWVQFFGATATELRQSLRGEILRSTNNQAR